MARVGIVSKWSASGQAVLARQVRSALDELGHESFVLARPGSGPRAARAAAGERDPVWDQPGVTEASAHDVPLAEYEDWARANSLEAILFDENYQWAEIAALRGSGIRTIGRFVWEYFAAEHLDPARDAYDTIYSLTRCERDRYAEMGLATPYVQWGIHPELLTAAADAVSRSGPARGGAPPQGEAQGGVRTSSAAVREGGAGETGRAAEDFPGVVSFYFPGSVLGRRKPIRKVIKAFGMAEGEHLRLLINAQVPRNDEVLREAAAADPRIELMLEDEPEAEHRARFAACDVCLAPSRWEGLGLPLYEATAFGMPIITNDKPPMSEMVLDGRSGILVPSTQNGTARSGIPAWDPDVPALAAAIERLGDRAELERMRDGVAELAAERSWSRTVSDLAALIGT
jgi:glycosyltransferase involved in cell wall biosynthesis